MKVTQSDTGWIIVDDDGRVLGAGFASNAEAWRWADRLTEAEQIEIFASHGKERL